MTQYTIYTNEIMGDSYYRVSITSSNYNPQIDVPVTITVHVTDVYGDDVTGETIALTCSSGEFTAVNGSTITAAASISGVTDASGEITATYNCSEWGIITFTSHGSNTQILVDGYRETNGTSSTTWGIYRNKTMGKLVLNGYTLTSVGTGWTQFGGSSANYCSDKRPNGHVSGYTDQANVLFRVAGDGKIYYKSMTGSTITSADVYLQLLWSIRDEDL